MSTEQIYACFCLSVAVIIITVGSSCSILIGASIGIVYTEKTNEAVANECRKECHPLVGEFVLDHCCCATEWGWVYYDE